MKNIVMVKRDDDGRERVYELPLGMEVKKEELVEVEHYEGTTIGIATMDSIEIEDGLLRYFTPRALRRVVATISRNPLEWEDEAPAAEDAEE